MPWSTGTYDIAVNQAATFSLLLTLYEDIEETQLIDLTGYSALMQVRRGPCMEVIVELSTDNGKITLGGEDGSILMELTARETAQLPTGIFFYDLLLRSDGGVDDGRVLEGKFEVRPAITVPSEYKE